MSHFRLLLDLDLARAAPGSQIVSRRVMQVVGLWFALLAASTARADVLQQSDEQPPPPASAGDESSVTADTQRLMQEAARRLADGRLDDETARLHQEILDQLRRVLETAQQQSAQRVPVPSDEPSAGGETGNASSGGTGDQAAGGERTNNAADSSDRPGEAELSDGEIQHRRNLANAVWGHLPARERDRMEGAFSERFLPQYDDLVRRYYESLATDSTGEPQ